MSKPPTIELTADQVESFRENGFLRLERVTTDEEVEWFRGMYDEVLERRHGEVKLLFEGERDDGSVGTIEQVIAPEMWVPAILETSYFANAKKIATVLLGVEPGEIERSGTMMVYKPAGEGRDTPWHQDEAYWDQPDVQAHSLSVWMPLEPVTVESGCMQFIPGSHKQEILAHKHMGPGEPLRLVDPPDSSTAVACPLPAGGATVHYCRTVHYTGPNTSDSRRRAISAVLHGALVPRDEPFPRPWLPLTPLL